MLGVFFGQAAVAVPHPSLSAQIVLSAAAAIIIGVVDAALVARGLAGAQGAFQFVPLRIWLVAPLVWTAVGAVTIGALLLFTRRWIGILTPGILAIIFLAIRLRSRPALLLVAVVSLTLVLAAIYRPILRLLVRPRRFALGGIVVCLGASAMGLAADRSTPAPSDVNAPVDAPNVILIFLDTVRYDAVFDGAGDVHHDLPSLARLRQDSTVFTRAYATSPWTLPSHLSAITGLPAHELGVSFDAQVYDRPDQTLAERFRERGYRTGAVISNSFLNAGSGFSRGFDTFHQAQAALDVCRTAPGLLASLLGAGAWAQVPTPSRRHG